MVKICPYCSYENEDKANFCSNCGKTLLFNENTIPVINYKKIISISYILTITFSWGGLIFNTFFNNFGFIGFIGMFLPFYLIQSSNPIAKKHGYIQIVISLIGIFLTSVFVFKIFQ